MVEYTWRANFVDNTSMSSTEYRYDNIDRDNIETFDLMDGEEIIHRLIVKPGDTFFYRRRVEKILNPSSLEQFGEKVTFMVGIVDDIYFKCTPDGEITEYRDDPNISLVGFEVARGDGDW